MVNYKNKFLKYNKKYLNLINGGSVEKYVNILLLENKELIEKEENKITKYENKLKKLIEERNLVEEEIKEVEDAYEKKKRI